MAGPIKPDEVAAEQKRTFPPEVFDAFNAEIAANFGSNEATVLQKNVVARLLDKGFTYAEIMDKGLLNVEEAYRAEGWLVSYDKPGFNESYSASFTFVKSRAYR